MVAVDVVSVVAEVDRDDRAGQCTEHRSESNNHERHRDECTGQNHSRDPTEGDEHTSHHVSVGTTSD